MCKYSYFVNPRNLGFSHDAVRVVASASVIGWFKKKLWVDWQTTNHCVTMNLLASRTVRQSVVPLVCNVGDNS